MNEWGEWRELSTGQRVCILILGVVLGVGGLAFSLPYLLVYGVPFVAIGLALGVLWGKGCRRSVSDRRYARLALFIPLSLGLCLLLVSYFEPAHESSSQGALPQAEPLKTHREIRKKGAKETREGKEVIAPGQEAHAPDVWNERFNQLSSRWYGAVFRTVPLRSNFSLRDVKWILLLAVGLGGPLGFALFYSADWEDFQREVHRQAMKEENVRCAQYEEKYRKLDSSLKAFEKQKGEIRKALQERDEMIRKLKERERYLTEGKPGKLERPPGAPDLDFL